MQAMCRQGSGHWNTVSRQGAITDLIDSEWATLTPNLINSGQTLALKPHFDRSEKVQGICAFADTYPHLCSRLLHK